jgi:nucleoside-diphosphate-sugar epimerase
MGGTITPSKVLVTGANGYIAMWVIDMLLNRGFTVRGSVRSAGKAHDLRKAFRDFVHDGKLEFVTVDDITKVCIHAHSSSSIHRSNLTRLHRKELLMPP